MLFSSNVGIDLGTATVQVHLQDKGIVVNEPSVVAMEQKTKKVMAVGEEAYEMLGRTPGNIQALRPLQDGVIADFDTTESMLKHFLAKAGVRRSFVKPRVVVCVPAGITTVEQKAVIEALMRIGAREAYMIEEPRAAALGAGLDIFQPTGNMVVDIGGGTSDAAVISMGDVVVSSSVRIGGDKFNEAIERHLRKEYHLAVGERTADELKRKIDHVEGNGRDTPLEVRGRDLIHGLPHSIQVNAREIMGAMGEPLEEIMEGVKQVLENTPPELAGDVGSKGAILTGGGALLSGLTEYLSREVGLAFYLAEDPINCVVTGTSKVLDNMDLLAPTLITPKKVSAR